MNETGFKCPKCGQTENFEASEAVVVGPVLIGPDGWDYWTETSLVELTDRAFMSCCECGFSTHASEFRKACTDEWWPKEEK